MTIGRLHPGDCVELRTTNSVYSFWVEYPDQGIGILSGGILAGPTRVKLTNEDASISEPATSPITVGGRAKTTLLDPSGQPVRCIITSTIAAILVYPDRRVAA